MYRVILAFAFVASVASRDLEVGQNLTEAKKIFDEKHAASPTVWRVTDKVTVNTTDGDVISRIVVTDLRADKDGDVNIVEGGEGKDSVTIELKSPTALRGYEFNIAVYAVPKGVEITKATVKTDKPELLPPKAIGNVDLTTKLPASLSTDVTINDGKRITRDSEVKPQHDSDHHVNTASTKQSESADKKATDIKNVNQHTPLADVPSIIKTDGTTVLPKLVDEEKSGKNEHGKQKRDIPQVPPTTSTTSKYQNKELEEVAFHARDIVLFPGPNRKDFDEHNVPIPSEDNKGLKEHSSTLPSTTHATISTSARNVRSADVTTPKTELKKDTFAPSTTSATTSKPTTAHSLTTLHKELPNTTDKSTSHNVQNIPSDGHVAIPKDLLNADEVTPKVSTEKPIHGVSPTPKITSIVPNLPSGSTLKPRGRLSAEDSSEES